MKRPLCILAVVFTAVLFMVQTFRGDVSVQEQLEGYEEGKTVLITGTITECEQQQQYAVTTTKLFLKNAALKQISFSYQKETQSNNREQLYQEMITTAGRVTGPGQLVQCELSGEQYLSPGSRVVVEGKLSFFQKATNPGEFDAAKFYRNRDIMFAVKEGKLLACSRTYNKLLTRLEKLKQQNITILSEILSPQEASVMQAMLFGEKEELDEELKKLYQQNGIAHVLAISGLHISMLGMAFYRLLKKILLPEKAAVILSEAMLVGYGTMVGFSASSFRAIFMFSLFLLSKAVKRTYDMLTALAYAEILLLLLHPGYLYDCAFQLSFLAILGIGCILPALKRLIPLRGRLPDAFMASLCVMITTAPVLIYHYHELSFYSIFLNLIVIPLMSILLGTAILLLILYQCRFPFAEFLVYPVKLILKIYQLGCLFTEKLPYGRRNFEKLSTWELILYYGTIILATILVNKWSKKRLSLLILVSCILLTMPKNRDFCVCFLNVGQGDCAVIKNVDNHVYLVDGGSSSRKKIGKRVIIPFLKSRGINQIDGIFLSHPDEDHMNGLVEVILEGKKENIRIGAVYLYESTLKREAEKLAALLQAAVAQGIPVYGIAAGDKLKKGDLEISCLLPEATESKSHRQEVLTGNAASVVLQVSFGEADILFTGDMEEAAEEKLLINGDIISQSIEILKVAHHGSRNSTTERFLKQVSPQLALISCGQNNSYGHPHTETLERLQEQDVKYKRTDESGAVTIRIDGKRMWVEEYGK